MKTTSILSTLTLLGASSAFAAVDFQITEIWIGMSGEDGTADWFEITNFGDSAGDTGALLYDDVSPTVASAGALSSILLNAGQSAIFMIENVPVDGVTYTTAIEEFNAIWNYTGLIGFANGGGGLGGGGDTVNIGVDDAGSFSVIDSVAYDGTFENNLATIDTVGANVASQIGVNGAYSSIEFFNDNVGDADNMISLVGSPGVIPEPSTYAMLAGLGVLLIALRRRQ